MNFSNGFSKKAVWDEKKQVFPYDDCLNNFFNVPSERALVPFSHSHTFYTFFSTTLSSPPLRYSDIISRVNHQREKGHTVGVLHYRANVNIRFKEKTINSIERKKEYLKNKRNLHTRSRGKRRKTHQDSAWTLVRCGPCIKGGWILQPLRLYPLCYSIIPDKVQLDHYI